MKDLFEVLNDIENGSGDLITARSMLEEASYDLAPVTTEDGSEEDNGRIRNLLRRREKILSFVYVALDYIDKAKERFDGTISNLLEQIRGGGGNLTG